MLDEVVDLTDIRVVELRLTVDEPHLDDTLLETIRMPLAQMLSIVELDDDELVIVVVVVESDEIDYL